jgi:phosphonate transport system substrate-binding protein
MSGTTWGRVWCRVLTALLVFAATPAVAGEPASYRFGVVPQFDARTLSGTWNPVLDDLAARTGLRFELIGTPRIPDFERDYRAGYFDFAYMNPYHVLAAARAQGYVPLVRDRRALRGILVVRHDSRYRQIRDLDGQTIAFPAPNAFAASLLIRADLTRRYRLRFEPRYVMTHGSVYLNVVTGQAPAGGGVRETFDAQPRAVRDLLRVLYTTQPQPAHAVVAHRRVPAAVQERVRRALLAMGASPGGRARLATVSIEDITVAGIDEYRAIERLGLEAFVVLDGP